MLSLSPTESRSLLTLNVPNDVHLHFSRQNSDFVVHHCFLHRVSGAGPAKPSVPQRAETHRRAERPRHIPQQKQIPAGPGQVTDDQRRNYGGGEDWRLVCVVMLVTE